MPRRAGTLAEYNWKVLIMGIIGLVIIGSLLAFVFGVIDAQFFSAQFAMIVAPLTDLPIIDIPQLTPY